MDNLTQALDLQGGVEPEARPMPPPVALDQMVYGPDGKLTREGMEMLIKAGRSVMHGSSVVSTIDKLPTEAQLAKGNAQKQAAVAQNIREQIAALTSTLASVTPDTSQHIGDTSFPSLTGLPLPDGVKIGQVGEGDTAGLDGDAGDTGSLAGEKAAAEAKLAQEAEAKALQEQAEAERLAKEAQEKLEVETKAAIAAGKKKEGDK